jgi:hypothetical protein
MFTGWRIEVKSPVRVLCIDFVPDPEKIGTGIVTDSRKQMLTRVINNSIYFFINLSKDNAAPK